MKDSTRLRTLLIVLGVALVVLVWSRFDFGGDDARPAASLAAGQPAGAAGRPAVRRSVRRGEEPAPVSADQVVAVQLEALEAQGGQYSPGRNPFDFYTPPPPPPPPPPPRREEPKPPPPPVVEQKPVGPQPPAVRFSFLGSFGRTGKRIAVFTDPQGNIYNVLVGEVLARDFRLVDIGLESVQIEYVDFPELPPKKLAVGGEGT